MISVMCHLQLQNKKIKNCITQPKSILSINLQTKKLVCFNPVADPDWNQTTTIPENRDETLPYFNIQLIFYFISNCCCRFDAGKRNIFDFFSI